MSKTRLLVVAMSLAVGACRAPTAAPVCPTCPTCPPQAAAPPATLQAPAPKQPEDEEVVVPALLNTRLAMIVAEAHVAEEGLDESEEPLVHLHIRIAPRDGGAAKVLERSSAPVDCLEVEPMIELVYGNEEFEIVDVRVTCQLGEEWVRLDTEHTLVHIAANEADLDAKVVFTGQSTTIDNRRVEVTSDRLDFFVEAGALAIYRHRVAWCDHKSKKTLMGEDFTGCVKPRKRTLTLVKRIALD